MVVLSYPVHEVPGQEIGVKLRLSIVKMMAYKNSCEQSNQSYDLHYDLQNW